MIASVLPVISPGTLLAAAVTSTAASLWLLLPRGQTGAAERRSRWLGGLLGLALLNWLGAAFGIYQPLDVLTMLGFVILIGTVVNNPILIVERALQLVRDGGAEPTAAILEAVE